MLKNGLRLSLESGALPNFPTFGKEQEELLARRLGESFLGLQHRGRLGRLLEALRAEQSAEIVEEKHSQGGDEECRISLAARGLSRVREVVSAGRWVSRELNECVAVKLTEQAAWLCYEVVWAAYRGSWRSCNAAVDSREFWTSEGARCILSLLLERRIREDNHSSAVVAQVYQGGTIAVEDGSRAHHSSTDWRFSQGVKVGRCHTEGEFWCEVRRSRGREKIPASMENVGLVVLAGQSSRANR